MYYPNYIQIPEDVYRKSLNIAASYYKLKKRRTEFDGMEWQSTINEWQIQAIEDAWQATRDETERDFIRKNLFEGIQMRYIALPMSQSTMKRVRKIFLYRLAGNLGFM